MSHNIRINSNSWSISLICLAYLQLVDNAISTVTLRLSNRWALLSRVRQHCSHCGHEWAWNSQPFIKDTPAGNILLLASIQFSGCTPGKVIHFLNCVRVACIADRTFYLHQTQYLELAVLSVWKDKQHQLLSAILKQCSAIIIGGDGRAGSPGHSAKFGSYGILDLNTNKVLHIELVQVLSKSIVHSNSYYSITYRATKSSPATTWRKWAQ